MPFRVKWKESKLCYRDKIGVMEMMRSFSLNDILCAFTEVDI